VTLGGAATEAAKGLSASPTLLLIAVVNALMVAALIYVGISQRDERAALTQYLIECHKAP
jgi:hypothetical protein